MKNYTVIIQLGGFQKREFIVYAYSKQHAKQIAALHWIQWLYQEDTKRIKVI